MNPSLWLLYTHCSPFVFWHQTLLGGYYLCHIFWHYHVSVWMKEGVLFPGNIQSICDVFVRFNGTLLATMPDKFCRPLSPSNLSILSDHFNGVSKWFYCLQNDFIVLNIRKIFLESIDDIKVCAEAGGRNNQRNMLNWIALLCSTFGIYILGPLHLQPSGAERHRDLALPVFINFIIVFFRIVNISVRHFDAV